MISIQTGRLREIQGRATLLVEKLQHHDPRQVIPSLEKLVDAMNHRLLTGIQHQLQQQRHHFTLQARSLDNLSPLKTLARGYAAVSKDNRIINSASQLRSEDEIDIRFSDGSKSARVL